MRDLLKNTVKLWYVAPTGRVEKTDTDGNYTSDFTVTYSTPVQISLSLYPISSTISQELFGIDNNITFISTSCSINMQKDALLFINEPVGDYYKTFDYKIESIKPSLNSTSYGLAVR